MIQAMPKKAVRKPHASDIRRGNKTQADLRQGIAEIRQTAAALDAIVRRMEQAEIAELKLDGVNEQPLSDGGERSECRVAMDGVVGFV